MSFKILHSFIITIEKEIEEISTRTENGQEITIKSKVKKPVDNTIVLKEPSRREKQDLSLFQGIVYNEAINKGLLPKVVMQQKIAKEPNNPLSEAEDKNLNEMNIRLQELANDFIRLNTSSSTDKEDVKIRKQKLLTEYIALQKRVIDINSAYQSVYAYTAENYMHTKTLSWLAVMLTYKKEGDKYSPLFSGNDFQSREQNAADLEDAKDELFLKTLDKLPTYWVMYLFGRATNSDEFKVIEEELAKQLEADEAMKKEEKNNPLLSTNVN